jgi:glycine/D-amino acid oxidase-like deaminating enzyme
MQNRNLKAGIIGGGVAGSSVALYLSEIGVDVTLFEKSKSLVNGPPICHLHAGGNLYREISDEQCITLLKESIELIRMYPQAIDYRPTVIAVPLQDRGNPEDLFPRLEKLKAEYKAMVQEDEKNRVLGEPDDYYKLFKRSEIEALRSLDIVEHPKSLEEWMIPFAKNVDLDNIKYPVLLVQEYGINIFRLAATASLSLEKIPTARVLTETLVTNVSKRSDSWLVEYEKDDKHGSMEFDYLVNAAGFRSGEIDDMLGFERERLVEFKAAYVTKCKSFNNTWPEIIFHGERGTPNGMAQFTPYPDGYFQLHGMTKDITLFDEGLVRSSDKSSQPKLKELFLNKIDKGWSETTVQKRTIAAIDHMAKYIPIFKNAKAMSKPLFGAQQIPGEDASLRAADISFEGDRYARCEIVKASSVLNMADEITKKLIELGYLDERDYKRRDFKYIAKLREEDIQKLAEDFAECREYPKAISHRSFSA